MGDFMDFQIVLQEKQIEAGNASNRDCQSSMVVKLPILNSNFTLRRRNKKRNANEFRKRIFISKSPKEGDSALMVTTQLTGSTQNSTIGELTFDVSN